MKEIEKRIIKLSYQSAMNAAARIYSYAFSAPMITETDLNETRDALVTSDLIDLCIHARRLIDVLKIRKIAKDNYIKTNLSSQVSLWDYINVVIHHEELMIITTKFQLKVIRNFANPNMDPYQDLDFTKSPSTEPISPLLLIKSDKSERIVIEVAKFIEQFIEVIFPIAIDTAEEKGIYLDSLFHD